ncbi:DNA/RNA non-specific endonuclease [uncultured Shewanella sp.]|uniref:DNA/RNA non-specific endonuclease n=1 Tax=uncultured Shewanella sp. TaxID=173975 RepID=UPI0026339E82|nr:DNA/RNA non-specific endonuclease [uncultured Shewanella sp.]
MKKTLITLLILVISTTAYADCGEHLTLGTPSDSDQLLCREGYALGYNYQNKVADWVAYYITTDSVNAYYERSNYFKTDSDLPSDYQSISDDYTFSGYDRGHLAPSGTMDFNEDSMQESFLMSNMAPQLAGFNRGGWKGLEEIVREWANEYVSLYVVTGPIWDGNETYIGNGVYIPTHFYKVILDPYFNDAIAFILPHESISSSELANYITTVDAVEALTGLDFFSELDDSIENDIEAVKWTLW